MTTSQSSLFDGPGRVHRNAHDTEIAAAEAFPEIKGEQRLAVLRAFVDAGSDGLTDYECHLVCGMHRPHIAGTRREELMAAGVPIVKTDQRRPTDTGALAIVWALDARHSRALVSAVLYDGPADRSNALPVKSTRKGGDEYRVEG